METQNGNNMVMPVAPYGGGYGGMDCFGGGNWAWIILLLLIAGNGWGGFGGFGGMGGFAADGAMLYPWMNQADITTSGFQNAATNQAIASLQNSVTSGFGDVQTALCGGFAGVNSNIANGFAQAEISENARQMANMNQMFGIQSALQNCCCENRAGIADLKYTVATENCADRTQSMQNTRDIIDAQARNTQAVLDKLCQLELDGVKQNYENRIAGMQNVIDGLSAQVNAADRRVAMGEEVDALYNRLNSCPVPTTPVYGRTPIFQCNNNGCGCGCGNF